MPVVLGLRWVVCWLFLMCLFLVVIVLGVWFVWWCRVWFADILCGDLVFVVGADYFCACLMGVVGAWNGWLGWLAG